MLENWIAAVDDFCLRGHICDFYLKYLNFTGELSNSVIDALGCSHQMEKRLECLNGIPLLQIQRSYFLMHCTC